MIKFFPDEFFKVLIESILNFLGLRGSSTTTGKTPINAFTIERKVAGFGGIYPLPTIHGCQERGLH